MPQSKQETKPVIKKNVAQEHPVADKLQGTLHESVDTLAEKVGSAEDTLRATAQSSSATLAQKQSEIKDKWDKSGAPCVRLVVASNF